MSSDRREATWPDPVPAVRATRARRFGARPGPLGRQNALLRLQRAIGNRATVHLVRSPALVGRRPVRLAREIALFDGPDKRYLRSVAEVRQFLTSQDPGGLERLEKQLGPKALDDLIGRVITSPDEIALSTDASPGPALTAALAQRQSLEAAVASSPAAASASSQPSPAEPRTMNASAPPPSVAAPVDPYPLEQWEELFLGYAFPEAHVQQSEHRDAAERMLKNQIYELQPFGLGKQILTQAAKIVEVWARRFGGGPAASRFGPLLEEVQRGARMREGYGGEDPGDLLQEGSVVLSFAYSGHQVYVRVFRHHGLYRLEYYDRQRQTLDLTGRAGKRSVPGYLQGDRQAASVPIWFDFACDVDTLTKRFDHVRKLASEDSNDQDTPRRRVLEYLAEEAADFGTLDVQPEPPQDPKAVHCSWASLESVLRAQLGPDTFDTAMRSLRDWLKEWAKRSGNPLHKQIAGVQ